MNEKTQSILDELTQLNIGDLEDVLLGLLTHVDDAFVTNFNAERAKSPGVPYQEITNCH